MSQFSPLQATTDYNYCINKSDSALIKSGDGAVQGIIINSHSSGQIKIWDSLTASGTVLANTMVLSNVAVTGERSIPFFGAKFLTGLYVQVVSGTVDYTVVYSY